MKKALVLTLLFALLGASLTAQTITTVPGGSPLVSNEPTGYAPVVAGITRSATLQSAATSSVNGSTLSTVGMSAADITVTCTGCSGGTTVTFQGSQDGSNFTSLSAVLIGTTTIATSTTTAGVTVWEAPVAGLQTIRTPISGYSAGTITVTATTVPVTSSPKTVNANSTIGGAAASSNKGVADASTQRMIVAQSATYAFATAAKTATAAGTGPFFAICGSATKTVRLQQLIIGGTVATAAVYADVELRKTSAATSSGTPTALTKVPHDSNSAASTANLLNFYTALATSGASVGFIGSQGAVFPITGTVAAQQAQVIFDWTNRQESEAPVLRGTAQCIEASFGTTTTNAPTLTISGIFTEE
jgi:hypothetical protein